MPDIASVYVCVLRQRENKKERVQRRFLYWVLCIVVLCYKSNTFTQRDVSCSRYCGRKWKILKKRIYCFSVQITCILHCIIMHPIYYCTSLCWVLYQWCMRKNNSYLWTWNVQQTFFFAFDSKYSVIQVQLKNSTLISYLILWIL